MRGGVYGVVGFVNIIGFVEGLVFRSARDFVFRV